MRFLRRNAIALAALVLAMSGTSIAAGHYIITNTHQIKPRVLRALKGKRGPQGVQGARGASGPAGPAGAPGALGPAGPTNLSPLTTSLHGGQVSPGHVEQVSAFCPPGSRAVSGGGESGTARLEVSEMISNREGWFLIVENESGITVPIHAEAYCAGEGRAIAASRQPSRTVLAARKHAEHVISDIVARLVAERENERALRASH